MCLTSNFHALLFRDEVLGRGGDYFGNVARHRIGALRRIVYICSHWDGYYAPACAGWVTQIINSARTMEEKLQFDPNAPGVDNGNYFGMPFTPQQAELVLLPVPWEVTVSYGGGTARGPEAIRLASLQVDLYEPLFAQGWRRGIATLPADAQLSNRSAALRAVAGEVIAGWEQGVAEPTERMRTCIGLVDQGSQRLNEWVYATACRWLDAGKRVGLIGGDHSVPLGLIRALSERHKGMGVLHIDAHADLRQAYEGFRYSHASIMYNVLSLKIRVLNASTTISCPPRCLVVRRGVRSVIVLLIRFPSRFTSVSILMGSIRGCVPIRALLFRVACGSTRRSIC